MTENHLHYMAPGYFPPLLIFLHCFSLNSYWITCDCWMCPTFLSVMFGRSASSVQEDHPQLFCLTDSSCSIKCQIIISKAFFDILLPPKAVFFHISLTHQSCLCQNTSHALLYIFLYLFPLSISEFFSRRSFGSSPYPQQSLVHLVGTW